MSWFLLAPHHCRQTFSQRDVSLGEETSHILLIHNITINSNNLFVNFRWMFTFCVEKLWLNAPHIWRDFGLVLPFQTRLSQTKPVLPLSNKQGSQVKDQGWRQCCRNTHKKFPYRLTRDVSLLSEHASYISCILLSTLSWMEDSGLLECDTWVVRWVVPDILKVYNVFIFDGKAVLEQLIFLNCLTLKDEVITIKKSQKPLTQMT